MLLALHHRALDQRVLVDAFGMRQHRPRHLDGVVIGEAVDDFLRRVRDRRELGGERDASGGFDLAGQKADDVVEQRDLVVGILRAMTDEQVGHPAQHLGAARAGTVCNRGFDIRHK